MRKVFKDLLKIHNDENEIIKAISELQDENDQIFLLIQCKIPGTILNAHFKEQTGGIWSSFWDTVQGVHTGLRRIDQCLLELGGKDLLDQVNGYLIKLASTPSDATEFNSENDIDQRVNKYDAHKKL